MLLCTFHHLACAINNKNIEVQDNIVSKSDNINTSITTVAYLISELARALCILADIYRKLVQVGASWTLDPSMEAVNCKIKLANNKFILVNILAYNNFLWTKKGVILDV